MPSFDEREKGYERKFQQDQELAFKAKARRNHLFGLWVAARLGLAGEAAETYATGLVEAELAKGGDTTVLAKAATDLAAKGAAADEARLKLELEHCAAEARKQLGKS